MTANFDVQFVSDSDGHTTGVLIPIELWREIASERETAYLLQSPTMKERLLRAKDREEGFTLQEAQSRLGV
jgi:PHD/YefM family antitoxin component YafN of YafNO toxin-antitoxin module